MANDLSVTLDQSTTPWTVKIDQKNQVNEVSRSPNAQTITWQLTGNAASGSFGAINDPTHPGFAWLDPVPPNGVFGAPELKSNGNQLTISDLNNSASTSGHWVYQLWINVGGTFYKSIPISLTLTTTSPIIINK